MENILTTLHEKNFLVVGAARCGPAISEFLCYLGANVTLTDYHSEKFLANNVGRLRSLGINLDLGRHTEEYFLKADEIIVSPGVPLDIEPLKKAAAVGISIVGELEFAARYLKGKIIAITGSNGKTTTTTLIGNILTEAGFATQVGGNIGIPAICLVSDSTNDGFIVLEVSSFQLEAISKFCPQIAILLNITPDHLDRYTSFDKYAEAKLRIFLNQNSSNLAILNFDDPYTPKVLELLKKNEIPYVLFSRTMKLEEGVFVNNNEIIFRKNGKEQKILKIEDILIRGKHNIENVLAAVSAGLSCGILPKQLQTTVQSFRGVEHRLEWVAEINGVQFFNDSKATNVDATVKAIEAFSSNLLVILGGKDKGSDYAPLISVLNEKAAGVLLIGTAAQKIEQSIGKYLRESIFVKRCSSLDQAVELGFQKATHGSVVLLAPACASFDMFENYEHRGEVFKDAIENLKSKRLSK